VGLGLFIWRIHEQKHPARDFTAIWSPFGGGEFVPGILGMAPGGALFVVPLFTQSVLGFSATQTSDGCLAPGIARRSWWCCWENIGQSRSTTLLIMTGDRDIPCIMFDLSRITSGIRRDDFYSGLLFCEAVSQYSCFFALKFSDFGKFCQSRDIPAGSGFYNLTRQLGGQYWNCYFDLTLLMQEVFHRFHTFKCWTVYDPVTNSSESIH
jgi:DHA2 family multidrug resistance protein